MSNIVELDSESLVYITDDQNEFIGVKDISGPIAFLNDDKTGMVSVNAFSFVEISKENFKSLCVAWLALNYPDTLKFDEEE